MSEPITVVWRGIPVGKQRPRFARRGAFVKTYTPEKTVNFEDDVKGAIIKAMEGKTPIDGPVRIEVDARFPLPKSRSKAEHAAVAAGNLVPHLQKPDADNVLKSVVDAMNTIAVRDDKTIFDKRILKRYAMIPGITINIYPH